ncbi:MAG TPA: pitrilysin family protein [Myxococcaceae bacterium]|nr:pitrilysin family protein [Myxococcaceae bacterium]
MLRTLAGLSLLGSTLALAAPETPPVPGPTPPFELPATTRFKLRNGVQVTLVPYGAVPKSNVSLVVRLGNVDEPAGQTGLTDLTGKLLLQGTGTKSAIQVAEVAAKLGGAVAVNVREDETSLEMECLGDSTAEAVRLVAEVARTPSFPAAELARLKGDLLREVAIQRSQPQPLAEEAFARAIYGSHPYGRVLPVAAEVETFTLEQARQLWTRYAGADRAHLYVVGRFDPAAVRAAIEEAFGGWGKAKAPARPRPTPHAGKRVFLVDRPGAVQSTVRIGLPVVPPTSPDYIPLVVTDTLLGGSFGSRITANIREKHGYTYSPRSALGVHPGVGVWVEQADVTTKDTAAALREVLAEVEHLRKEPPTAEELTGIQKYVAGTFVLRNSSRAGIIAQLRFVDLYGLPADWLQTYLPRVEALKPADITRVTRQYLDPSRMTLVVVGDRTVVEDSLKQFGPVKIEAPR